MSKATRRRKRFTVSVGKQLIGKIDKVTDNRKDFVIGAINFCLNKHRRAGKLRYDLTGQKFGKLTAIYPTFERSSQGCVMWECVCDCGNDCEIPSWDLKSGKTQSCGCSVLNKQPVLAVSKISADNKYEYETDEHFKTLGNVPTCTNNKPTRTNKTAAKLVRCVETGEVFKSITEAAHAKGLKCPSNIGQVIQGKRRTAAGCHWEYAEQGDQR